MPERTEMGLLLVKAEGTYGTDPTPTQAANIIPTVRDQITYELQGEMTPRALLDGTLERSAGHFVRPSVVLKFRYELRGNRTDGSTDDISAGASGQAVEIDALLKAADLTPAYTAESPSGGRNGNVIYVPVFSPTSVGNSVTCWWYTEGKLHKLNGGKVDISFSFEAGKMAYIDFTVYGKYVAVSDNSFALSGAAFLSTKPPVWENGTCTYGGVSTLVVSQATINLGNKIVPRLDATAADSIAGFIRTAFEPNGKINPESLPEGTAPLWADLRSNTVKTLNLLMGADTGNKIQIQAITQQRRVSYENANGVRLQPIEFDIIKSYPGASSQGNTLSLKFF